jgi:hypothetical protein
VTCLGPSILKQVLTIAACNIIGVSQQYPCHASCHETLCIKAGLITLVGLYSEFKCQGRGVGDHSDVLGTITLSRLGPVGRPLGTQ